MHQQDVGSAEIRSEQIVAGLVLGKFRGMVWVEVQVILIQ